MLEPPCYWYSISTCTVNALEAYHCAKRYSNGSEAIVDVPGRALRCRLDVPSTSTKRCSAGWRQYRRASDVVDATPATVPGSDILDLADNNLLFERDDSWTDDLGVV